MSNVELSESLSGMACEQVMEASEMTELERDEDRAEQMGARVRRRLWTVVLPLFVIAVLIVPNSTGTTNYLDTHTWGEFAVFATIALVCAIAACEILYSSTRTSQRIRTQQVYLSGDEIALTFTSSSGTSGQLGEATSQAIYVHSVSEYEIKKDRIVVRGDIRQQAEGTSSKHTRRISIMRILTDEDEARLLDQLNRLQA